MGTEERWETGSISSVWSFEEGDNRYLAADLFETRAYAREADILGLGFSIYELAGNVTLPGNGDEWHSLRHGNLPAIEGIVSQELSELLHAMVHSDPAKRPTADGILAHPLLASLARPH
eukprot:NODE_1328_length_625_cov_673.074653_g1044_i0.p1 GENE.NODE_1328_length_625_cov_673.074653_g1044_i0~~NODE_1328_length_625_cov_673.074653_g1044_i0.p1  ORF type:complete len:127 (+),score=22.29 NODE_1328_length_625_cov_673.074653_g1044_i0:26-382(+)